MSYEYEFYDTPVGDLHPPLSNYETLQNGQREPRPRPAVAAAMAGRVA